MVGIEFWRETRMTVPFSIFLPLFSRLFSSILVEISPVVLANTLQGYCDNSKLHHAMTGVTGRSFFSLRLTHTPLAVSGAHSRATADWFLFFLLYSSVMEACHGRRGYTLASL